MDLKKQGKIFLNGLVVVTPLIITIYVVATAVLWLDRTMQVLFPIYIPGLGFMTAVVGIYVVGLTARSWLLKWPIRMAEAVVNRIPLVKSLYSAISDLLKFLGGSDAKSHGQPCVVRFGEGQPQLLGLITTESPRQLEPEDASDRVAVYLPMSYQIGGFTLYMQSDKVRRIEGMSVEELLKLCVTAGVSAQKTPLEGAVKADEGAEIYKEKHA